MQRAPIDLNHPWNGELDINRRIEILEELVKIRRKIKTRIILIILIR